MNFLLTFVLAVALTAVGCGASRQEKMAQKVAALEKAPAATTIEGAKALYDGASKTLAWLEAHPEDSTPTILAKARALRNRRALEIGKTAGNAALEGINKVLGSLGLGDGKSAVSVGQALDQAVDKILGVGTPKHKKFGCPDEIVGEDGKKRPFNPLEEGASRYCP